MLCHAVSIAIEMNGNELVSINTANLAYEEPTDSCTVPDKKAAIDLLVSRRQNV